MGPGIGDIAAVFDIRARSGQGHDGQFVNGLIVTCVSDRGIVYGVDCDRNGRYLGICGTVIGLESKTVGTTFVLIGRISIGPGCLVRDGSRTFGPICNNRVR